MLSGKVGIWFVEDLVMLQFTCWSRSKVRMCGVDTLLKHVGAEETLEVVRFHLDWNVVEFVRNPMLVVRTCLGIKQEPTVG